MSREVAPVETGLEVVPFKVEDATPEGATTPILVDDALEEDSDGEVAITYDEVTDTFVTHRFESTLALRVFVFATLIMQTQGLEMTKAVEDSIVFSRYTEALGYFLIYVMISYVLYAIAAMIWKIRDLVVATPSLFGFLKAEWMACKVFLLTEWATVKQTVNTYVTNETQDRKKDAIITHALQLVPLGAAVLWGMGQMCFGQSNILRPQGWRGDVNRGGSAMTGMLAISMIMLAPLLGCARVLKFFRPILDLLRHLPYATWMANWLGKWFVGKADFDDLPQTPDEIRNLMSESPEAERLIKELGDIRKMQEQMQNENNFREKTPEKAAKMRSELQLATDNKVRNFKALWEDALLKKKQSDEDQKLYNEDETDQIAKQALEVLEMKANKNAVFNGAEIDDDPEKWTSEQKAFYRSAMSTGYFKKKGGEITPPPSKVEMTEIAMGVNQSEVLQELERLQDAGKENGDTTGLRSATEPLPKESKETLRKKVKKPVSASFVEKGKGKAERKTKILSRTLKVDENLKPQSLTETAKSVWDTVADWFCGLYVDYKFPSLARKNSTPTTEETQGSWGYMLEKREQKVKKIRKKIGHTFKKQRMNMMRVMLAFFVVGGLFMIPKQLTSELPPVQQVENLATPQAGKRSRGQRVRRRHNGKRFINPSGGAEQIFETDSEDSDNYYHWEAQDQEDFEEELQRRDVRGETYDREDFIQSRREEERKWRNKARRQAASLPDYSALKKIGGDDVRRKIYAAKNRSFSAPTNTAATLKAERIKAFENEALKTQSFKPNVLAAGVYKFYLDKRYLCTATQVSNRLYVVLHALSEDFTVEYTATNHVRTLKVKGSDLVLVNSEIGYFPVPGIPSVWKNKDFRVLEDAAIVSVMGYGTGESVPDIITGFASPQGWCNIKTRDGDCTSPVLDVDGKIVGFWTHGNGRDFGRFEPVTKEFKESLSSDDIILHTGLGFRSSPLSQPNY